MKSTWILAACALLMVGTAEAAPPKHRVTHRHRVVHRRVVRRRVVSHSSGAETSLVGIHLFDSGVRVVQMYGTPDDIQPVDVGGGAIGGGGGGRPNGGFPGPGGGGRQTGGSGTPTVMGGGGGGSSSRPADFNGPADRLDFQFGNQTLMQYGEPPSGEPGRGGQNNVPPAAGRGGGPAGLAGPPGVPGGGGGGMGGGSTERTQYTRWIYNRGGSKYGFVLDKFNRVIQIEAIGLSSARVSTHAGIHFGDNFAKIMRTYGAPDGYEIAGNTIVVRFLSRKKVAFRLNRLAENKPHQVTGIVVAAGK